ncbi:MAG: phosphatidate cytidylyltransferase [Bacillota bacterium]|nr:phosphatidate cytidylyltransferase [Bacillota bacterium]
MKTRILSACIMLPLLALVFLGGKVLLVACFVIGLMGVGEFYRGFEALGVKPCRWIGYLSALALAGVGLFHGSYPDRVMEYQLYFVWFFAVVLASLLYLFSIEKRQPADAAATITGAFYVVFFSYHVVLVDQSAAPVLVWLIFLSAFGTDIMAYFTGVAIGKHKLCPKISPKKTIEGSIGGILGSVILCGLFGWFFAEEYFVHCLVVGGLGGVISQLGDLTASIFKRKMGIKDYGNLIPGHGGILDRFDSVLFTAPMVYYYIVFVLGFGAGYPV